MRTVTQKAVVLIAGLGVVLGSHSSWCDFVTYQQSPVDGGLALVDGSMMGGYLADNFTLSTGNGVDAVSWWGGYLGQDTALPSSFSSDFTIAFYSDSGGHPGALVQSYTVTDVTRTATGLLGNDMSSTPSEFIYEFTYELPNTLALASGTTYYLSIFDTTNANSTWLAGSGGNGVSFYGGNPTLNGGAWAIQHRDFAFELSPVPEPISMVMLCSLGAGMYAARKLRRSTKA